VLRYCCLPFETRKRLNSVAFEVCAISILCLSHRRGMGVCVADRDADYGVQPTRKAVVAWEARYLTPGHSSWVEKGLPTKGASYFMYVFGGPSPSRKTLKQPPVTKRSPVALSTSIS